MYRISTFRKFVYVGLLVAVLALALPAAALAAGPVPQVDPKYPVDPALLQTAIDAEKGWYGRSMRLGLFLDNGDGVWNPKYDNPIQGALLRVNTPSSEIAYWQMGTYEDGYTARDGNWAIAWVKDVQVVSMPSNLRMTGSVKWFYVYAHGEGAEALNAPRAINPLNEYVTVVGLVSSVQVVN